MSGRILVAVLISALCAGVAGATPGDSTKSVPDNPSTQPQTSVGNGASEPAPTASKASSKKSKKSKTKGKSMTAAGTMPVKPAIAPAHIEVQHILIGFAGTVPGKNITRTKEEASKLAHELLDKARNGANFDSLVAKYTDDSPPGIYKMAADGVPPQLGEYGRRQMVPAFGNVGFAISPGNIDIAEYDPTSSPFGWHIIKRLR